MPGKANTTRYAQLPLAVQERYPLVVSKRERRRGSYLYVGEPGPNQSGQVLFPVQAYFKNDNTASFVHLGVFVDKQMAAFAYAYCMGENIVSVHGRLNAACIVKEAITTLATLPLKVEVPVPVTRARYIKFSSETMYRSISLTTSA